MLVAKNSILHSTKSSYFLSGFKDSIGNVYGTLDGAYFMEGSKLKICYRSDQFSRIYDAILYGKNTALLGTNYGLFSFELNTKEIKAVNHSDLLRSRINCIYVDNDKNIWIGTKGKGLILMKNNLVKLIHLGNVLGKSISTIDRKGDILWISTNNGIAKAKVRIHKDSISLQEITRIPGLYNNEIKDLCIDSTFVYAATQNGLVRFKQNYKACAPPTYLTNVKINGKAIPIQKKYDLENNENNIEIGFVGLNYMNGSRTRYLYKLEGIDEDWISTFNTSVQYPSIQAGNYTFRLKAINYQGVETSTPLQLNFKINKAYYDTLWFKITIVLSFLLTGSLIALVVSRFKYLEERKRIALTQSMNIYKQQALSAQMNPHFIHNSLNSVQSYILQNDREGSSKFLSLFSRLMRKILENSRNQFISLKEEIEALQLYIELELIRFNHSFHFNLNIDKNIELRKVNVPPLILQPYVENAIHHGLRHKREENKTLNIKIWEDKNNIYISIQDNGVGRKKALEIKQRKTNTYKSLGMEITNKRMNLVKSIYKNQISAVIN